MDLEGTGRSDAGAPVGRGDAGLMAEGREIGRDH